MKKYDNLVVDCNLWYYRNYNTHKELTCKVKNKILKTGGIYGFLQSLHKWERDLWSGKGHIYFLFDNATSKQNLRKLLLDPKYKENRHPEVDAFYKGLDYLRLILTMRRDNNYVIYGTGYEADDLVPYVLDSYIDDKSSTLVISEDFDWTRIIEWKKKPVYLYQKKIIYDRKKFLEEYNFIPTVSSIVIYKSIRGDKSDNIPIGAPRLPTNILLRIVEDFKSVYDLFDNLSNISYIPQKWKDVLRKNQDRITLNSKLVCFLNVPDHIIKDSTVKTEYNFNSLRIIYEALDFNIAKMDSKLYDDIMYSKDHSPRKVDDFFKIPKLF